MRLSLKIVSGITAILLLVNFAAFAWIAQRYDKLVERSLLETARGLYHEIVVVRSWVASHGGVLVPEREGVAPNPMLPGSEMETADGRVLVLRNPAMVTRELSRLGDEMGMIHRYRITSLEPINPDNEPDDFERRALGAIAAGTGSPLTGEGEYAAITPGPAGKVFRYVAPLTVEPTCLSCHGGQEIGEIRGGFSLTVPMEAVVAEQRENRLYALLSGLLISAGTALTAFVFLRRIVISPILGLEKAAESIGRGNFTTPIQADSQDEIGDLGRALARMQQEVASSTGRQIQAEKMVTLGEIAAGIAHDLRNPLFAIRSNIKYLRRRGEVDEVEEEVYGEVEEGIERIGRIVDAINEFARNHPPEFAPHHLSEIVEHSVALLGRQLERRGIGLEVDVPHDLPPIEADQHKLEQVLVNLLSNALHAVEGHGDRIRVTARPAGDHVRLSVSDNGQGVRPEILDRIFDPFFTRTPRGTGMGLTIVRRLVDQHHGRIAVESEAGHGATFHVDLPLRQNGEETT